MAGELSANAAAHHRNAVNGDSPGCNPGSTSTTNPRPNGADGGIVRSVRHRIAVVPCAPLGRGRLVGRVPRVAPWAITVAPVGGEGRAESAQREQAIQANMRGLGYGG